MNRPDTAESQIDPAGDAPERTDDQLDRAELTIGGKVVRPANGMLTRAGRLPLGAAAKRQ